MPPGLRPSGSDHGRTLLLVGLPLLLLVALVIGGLLLLADDDSGPEAVAVPTPTGPLVSSAAADPAPSETTAYMCWNGRASPTPSACGPPRNRKGMEWVFPVMKEASCEQLKAGGNREQFFKCTHTAPGGGAVRIFLSQWQSWEDADREYDYLSGRQQVGLAKGLVRWDITARRGDFPYKAALVYDGTGWAATVYASSAADRQRVLDRMVRGMLPKDDLHGTAG